MHLVQKLICCSGARIRRSARPPGDGRSDRRRKLPIPFRDIVFFISISIIIIIIIFFFLLGGFAGIRS
jgi:uncharacterized membrane protein YvbJ